jgi:hypothetical protein
MGEIRFWREEAQAQIGWCDRAQELAVDPLVARLDRPEENGAATR